MKYKEIKDWREHQLSNISSVSIARSIYEFIEQSVVDYESCLVVSYKNKCATVVAAIIYLLFKFRWKIHKCLEYINSKKLDIEITKTILKELSILEKKLELELRETNGTLRSDWKIDEKIDKYDPYDTDDDNLSVSSKSRLTFTKSMTM